MANQQIIDYIKSNLDKGFSIDELKKKLIVAGWPEKDVEEAVDHAYYGFSQKTAAPTASLKNILNNKIFKLWIPIILIIIIIIAGLVFYFYIFNEKPERIPQQEKCIEEWSCNVWSECVNGEKTRECIEIKNCGTEIERPEEFKVCIAQEIKNETHQKKYAIDGITSALEKDSNREQSTCLEKSCF